MTPLVDVTGGGVSPKTLRIASASAASLSGVDVPCALTCAMSRGGEAGVVERELHARGRAFAAGRRRGDVVRVGVAAVADDLAVDARAACDRAVPTLEHERGRAFAHDEAVAVGVERPRRVLGVVVARR